MSATFAATDAEAKAKFEAYELLDPFPDIAQALLNSADISDYVRVTGMLFPFNASQGKLKPASYEIDFYGDIFSWRKASGEPEHKRIERTAGVSEFFELKRNSICFFSPDVVFRIPSYMALRFNLRIKHVHRGLLLGTGPLVDPGYCGRLLIPLHNLTSQPYRIRFGEGLIWVEFTKISELPIQPSTQQTKKQEPRVGTLLPFPEAGRYISPDSYLRKAGGHSVIRSSVIDLEQKVREFKRNIRTVTWAAAISGLLAVGGIVVPTILSAHSFVEQTTSLIQDASNYVSEAKGSSLEMRSSLESQQRVAVAQIESELNLLRARIAELEKKGATDTTINHAVELPNKSP